MAFIPAENVLQVELRGTLHGVPVENTLYFQCEDAINDDNIDLLFDYVQEFVLEEEIVYQASAMLWNEIYGTDLTSVDSPVYSRSFITPLQGAVTSTPALPGNVAFVLSFRTRGRGRSSRGRNYLTGFVEAQVTANVMSSTVADSLVAIYGGMLGIGGFPPEWEWVVLSRQVNGVPRSAGLPQPVVDVLYTDLVVDTQRGRLR